MKETPSKRIDFVDLTKGVCIILVVMTHIGGAFELLDRGSMLSCFRMPLYFFISGVFFKPYEALSGFILRKINKLIIPFLFLSKCIPPQIHHLENSTGSIPFTCIMERTFDSISWT